ncbi:hypothetical protein HON22_02055 [Candidatus Peregrinibacteria bacterium]|jgi:hypothetical protein|nr:hypothetical protein [Candidatus Peregrinibacteria bacterium]
MFGLRIDIIERNVTCLGKQVLKIINAAKPFTEDCFWYTGDVLITGLASDLQSGEVNTTKKFDFKDLCTLLEKASEFQFMSGVFIAKLKNLKINLNQKLETEEMKTIQIQDAIIEIRIFDTSYFEVYTKNKELKKALQEKFKVEIFKCDF